MTARRNAREIDPALLRQLIDYDSETGILTWKPRDPCWFKCDVRLGRVVAAKRWNNRLAGKPAGTLTFQGYVHVEIRPLRFGTMGHRIAWAIHFGVWPSNVIDHINGDRADNRIKNLRDVSQAENNRNKRNLGRGAIGVSLHSSGKWQARIGVHGYVKRLGLFNCEADAISARKEAEIRFGFHPNHGAEARPVYFEPAKLKCDPKPKPPARQGVLDFG